jgi:hypothetical protein
MIKWLLNHLLPCPFKTLTGIDCPGCGFQRSFVALIQGNLKESWALYPPTIPLLIVFTIVAVLYYRKSPNRFKFTNAMVIVIGNFILISYLIKML